VHSGRRHRYHASGLLGVLLLWPNTERARLIGQALQPKFA
jgi:hypothetical protein